MDAITDTSDGVHITVWVTPNASRTRVGGLHDGAIRVWVTAPPEDGRANQAVARLLERRTGGFAAEVVSGHTSRRKRVVVKGVTATTARQVLTPDS